MLQALADLIAQPLFEIFCFPPIGCAFLAAAAAWFIAVKLGLSAWSATNLAFVVPAFGVGWWFGRKALLLLGDGMIVRVLIGLISFTATLVLTGITAFEGL